MLTMITLDTSAPGKAANVAARAAILFARITGMAADNTQREHNGYAMAYDRDCFEAAIEECFPELAERPAQ